MYVNIKNLLSVSTCNLLCQYGGYRINWLEVEIVYSITLEKGGKQISLLFEIDEIIFIDRVINLLK